MTSNVISLQTARELIGSGSIDGKRLPLIAFMDAQQAEIEQMRADWAAICEASEAMPTSEMAAVSEVMRLRAALMQIASRDVVDAADVAHRALQGETFLKHEDKT